MLLIFSIGAALSFLGSLPFGMINTSVAETAMRKDFRAGLEASAGASLVEFFQAVLSLLLIDVFVKSAFLDKAFQIVALVVFAVLAVYYLLEARKDQKPHKPKVNKLPALPDFARGALISSLNVLAFPYWIFYGAWLYANGWMQTGWTDTLVFSAGTMLGVFLALLLYAWLGVFLMTRATRIAKRVNWLLGLLFLALAAYQSYKILAA
jgi:threonine/homoserine/homoserine lactone efflux protein